MRSADGGSGFFFHISGIQGFWGTVPRLRDRKTGGCLGKGCCQRRVVWRMLLGPQTQNEGTKTQCFSNSLMGSFGKGSRESPRQTNKPKKGQFMNFSQGHSGTKVRYVNSACFPEEKHQNSQKWAKFMNFSFWPYRGLLAIFIKTGSTPTPWETEIQTMV